MDRVAIRQQRAACVDPSATFTVAVTAARLFHEHDERGIVPRRAAKTKSGIELAIQDVERGSNARFPTPAQVPEPRAFASGERRRCKRRVLRSALPRNGEPRRRAEAGFSEHCSMRSQPPFGPVAPAKHRARDDPDRLLIVDGQRDVGAPQPSTRQKRVGPIDWIDRPDTPSLADRPRLLA